MTGKGRSSVGRRAGGAVVQGGEPAASGAHIQPAMSDDLKSHVKLVIFVYKDSICLFMGVAVAVAVVAVSGSGSDAAAGS